MSQYDDVGLFGLDEFGDPTGLHPVYGIAVGAGVASLAAVAVREMAPAAAPGSFDWKKNSALVGTVAGIAAGGAMVAFPGTRYAGWLAILSAALSQGITALEVFLSSTPVFQGSLSGITLRNRPSPLRGLGNAEIQPRNALRGAQLIGANRLLGPQAKIARHYGSTSMNRG